MGVVFTCQTVVIGGPFLWMYPIYNIFMTPCCLMHLCFRLKVLTVQCSTSCPHQISLMFWCFKATWRKIHNFHTTSSLPFPEQWDNWGPVQVAQASPLPPSHTHIGPPRRCCYKVPKGASERRKKEELKINATGIGIQLAYRLDTSSIKGTLVV